MADYMIFPETIEEFIEQYKFKDDKEIYTNGVDLIPVFRIKQWMYHLRTPTADVTDVRHGEWIKKPHVSKEYKQCSVCKYDFSRLIPDNYCPNCGARNGEW